MKRYRAGTRAPVQRTTEEPARHGNPFRRPVKLAPKEPIKDPPVQLPTPERPLVPA